MDRQEARKVFKENTETILDPVDKFFRAEMIFALGFLENKRIQLSWSKKTREKLSNLKSEYENFKSAYPELLTLTLYGSHLKGYATKKSDFDGHIIVDVDKAINYFDPENLKPEDMVTRQDYDNFIEKQPKVFPENTKKSYAIAEAILLKYNRASKKFFGNEAIGERKLEVTLVDQNYIARCAASNHSQDYCSEQILSLFNLSLDKEVARFRKVVVDAFRAQGQVGENKWNNLMHELGSTERLENGEVELLGPEASPDRNEKIYPSLDKANKYFLID